MQNIFFYIVHSVKLSNVLLTDHFNNCKVINKNENKLVFLIKLSKTLRRAVKYFTVLGR